MVRLAGRYLGIAATALRRAHQRLDLGAAEHAAAARATVPEALELTILSQRPTYRTRGERSNSVRCFRMDRGYPCTFAGHSVLSADLPLCEFQSCFGIHLAHGAAGRCCQRRCLRTMTTD